MTDSLSITDKLARYAESLIREGMADPNSTVEVDSRISNNDPEYTEITLTFKIKPSPLDW